jgi:hypothetical protein
MTQLPRTAASHVLHEGLGALGDARLMAQTVGTGVSGLGGATKSGGAAKTKTHSIRPAAGGASTRSEEEPNDVDELLARVTPENGGLVSGPDGLAVGNPESQRIYDDAIARGAVPSPKGPKPIRQSAPHGERTGADRSGTDPDAATSRPQSPPRRVPIYTHIPAPTGPATPHDAWKWDGVPPGRSLIGKVEPGKMRYYMGDDGHGPSIKWLPAAWPPGEEPEP